VATPGIIGVLQPEGGWHATYVHYDGTPERLGARLLDEIVDHGGDLDAVWRELSGPPTGWRYAFHEPLDHDPGEWFETGRSGPPILSDTDRFVREQVYAWYLLDLRARTLSIFTADDHFAEAQDRIVIDEHGWARSVSPPSDPLDWRNRRKDYGADEPGATAVALVARLWKAFPLEGPRMSLGFPRDGKPSLGDAGLLVPIQLFLTDRPNADGSWAPELPAVSEILVDDNLLLAARRVLRSTQRAELALNAGLEALSACAAERKVPQMRHPCMFPEMFPFGYLDLELDDEALSTAVRQHVAAQFWDERS
jgi:hypothetical protein